MIGPAAFYSDNIAFSRWANGDVLTHQPQTINLLGTSVTWTKDLGTDVDFVDFDITFAASGSYTNINSIADTVHNGYDYTYTHDALNRLTTALRSGSGGETLWQNWGLDQLGNWASVQLDLDYAGGTRDFTGTGEYNDTRVHNLANELIHQNTDSDTGMPPTYEHEPQYSKNGEMTSDDNEYEYVWDAWGRLVSIDSIIAETNVSTMRYNGVGWMKSFTEPAGGGGSTTYWNTHDHKGRTLLTRRGTDVVGDDDPAFKQRYVYHNAGRAGSGSSSYRNAIVLRDGDLSNGWSGAADGTYEKRHYMLQNHRGDVVAMVTDTGSQAGHIRYDAYGTPTTLPAGDTDSDGDFDASDVFTGSYDIRKDVNLDGNNNVFDAIAASAEYGGYIALGRGTLGDDTAQHIRIGWQGSEHNSATPARLVHTPARVHHVILGRWLSRDPAGAVDGPNLYQYAKSGAVRNVDWNGLDCQSGEPVYGIDFGTGTGCGGASGQTSQPSIDPIAVQPDPTKHPNLPWQISNCDAECWAKANLDCDQKPKGPGKNWKSQVISCTMYQLPTWNPPFKLCTSVCEVQQVGPGNCLQSIYDSLLRAQVRECTGQQFSCKNLSCSQIDKMYHRMNQGQKCLNARMDVQQCFDFIDPRHLVPIAQVSAAIQNCHNKIMNCLQGWTNIF